MPQQPRNSARFVLKAGERTVTRDQILQAISAFDRKGLRERAGVGDNRRGWFLEEIGERYNPKWILKLATDTGLTKFTHKQARETLSALGFKLDFDPDWQSKKAEHVLPSNGDDDPASEEAEEANELTFDLERNLQKALRANIKQLETGLKITDGGKEQNQIDITAEDINGAAVVIELKAGEADRQAIGQILGYMGQVSGGKKAVRGILIAKDFSAQAVAAQRVVPGLQLQKYTFKFTFEIAGSD